MARPQLVHAWWGSKKHKCFVGNITIIALIQIFSCTRYQRFGCMTNQWNANQMSFYKTCLEEVGDSTKVGIWKKSR
jgi:hypothetical protein